jgi:hypothetical protein
MVSRCRQADSGHEESLFAMSSVTATSIATDAIPAMARPLQRALIENLYCELLVLADEARAGVAEGLAPRDPLARIRVACESLRLTSHLMQTMQWLLDMREDLRHEDGSARALPPLPHWDAPAPDGLPEPLVRQIDAAVRLRQRLYDGFAPPPAAPAEPAPHQLLRTIEAHFA